MPDTYSALQPDRFPIYTAGVEAVREYREGKKNRIVRPKVRLTVSPFVPTLIPVELVGQDMGGLIVSVSYQKSRSTPGGVFMVTLGGDDVKGTNSITGQPLKGIWRSLGASMRDVFKQRTVGRLYINGYHVMTGFLRSFRRKAVKTGNGFDITYEAQFYELGSIYEENILKTMTIEFGSEINGYMWPNRIFDLGGKKMVPSGLGGLTTAVQQYVQAFLLSTLDYGMGGRGFPYYQMSDGLPLMYRFIAAPAPLGAISNSTLFKEVGVDTALFKAAGGSSFWSFLQGLIGNPFYEMFTESGGRTMTVGRYVPLNPATVPYSALSSVLSGLAPPQHSIMLPGFNYLVIRSVPYYNPLIGTINPAHFFQLFPFIMSVWDLVLGGDFIIITDDDIIEKDLGTCDFQQYTGFHVSFGGKAPTGVLGTTTRPSLSSGPTLPFYPGGVKTFGMKVMTTNLDGRNNNFEGRAWSEYDKSKKKYDSHGLSHLLNYYFRNASKFMEGTVIARGIPYARPGMVCLYLPSKSGTPVDDERECPGLYYIDNVQYGLQVGGIDTTTLSLIRGTPFPMSGSAVAQLFFDWELFPPHSNTV